ncbi:MAG TPA: outer membrane beta-barrel protein [Flavitalea sp.]|nr:outer membrane beta-barrel protein [Flavitalea sp.]
MRKLIFTLLLCSPVFMYAQFPAGGAAGARGGQSMNIGRFYGKVVDEKTNKGIDAVSIQLLLNKFDTVDKKRKDTIISGMLTRKTGDFSLENLPVFGNYRLKITAIGYKAYEQKVAFELKPPKGGDMSSALAGVDKDLGNIKLVQDAEVLESVTVSGNKPLIQMGIDRKIFNVEKNITSAGGTAVDVMRNVPSLNVDVEGNVTLRNAAPTIFVDGRPTTLTLEQIPAEAISSVELITNPSAKFDASGGQSGILNIVLKKNRKAGYNGSIRAGIDSRAKFNLGGDINVRQGKVNMFVNAMYNQRKSIGWGETDRTNLFNGIGQTKIFQDNNSEFNGAFAFTRFGLDFFIDNRNTITFAQAIVGGNFKFDSRNDSRIDTLTGSGGIETQYRNTLGENTFRNYGSQISYKHLFAKAGKEWTADVNYNRSRQTSLSNIRFRSFNDLAMSDPKYPEVLQGITGGGTNRFVVAQTDFVNPLSENTKWEMGARTQIRTFTSNQKNFFDGVFKPEISNEFEYTDYIHAAYATFSQKIKDKLSYQIGLRAESSSYSGQQLGKQSYKQDFPISLFPSIFVTRMFKNNQDIQLNYSRRINRPNFFQLMPNTDFSDPLNYQTGNPDLKPEFTNSLELSYQKTYGEKNNTFLATLFGKYTTNLIARYQRPEKLGQTNDTALISTYINASSAYASGMELVFRNTLSKWWEINFNINFYYSKINGGNIVKDLENERTSYFAKMNNTFRVAKGWSIQLSGEYQSKSALPVSTSNSGGGGGGRGGGGGGGFGGGAPSTTQGYINANYGMDLGVRKDFMIKKNNASISLNFNDIFRTRRYFVYSQSTYFIQEDWRRRDPQIVRLNFNYRFGKFDVALFKRKNMRGEAEGMQNGMQGVQQ